MSKGLSKFPVFFRNLIILGVIGGPVATFVAFLALEIGLILQSLGTVDQSAMEYDRSQLIILTMIFPLLVLVISLLFGLVVNIVFCKVLIPFASLLAGLWSLFGASRLLGTILGIFYFGTVGFVVDRYGPDVIAIMHYPQIEDSNSANPFAAILVSAVIGAAIGWMSSELAIGRLGRWLLKQVFTKKAPWAFLAIRRKYKQSR